VRGLLSWAVVVLRVEQHARWGLMTSMAATQVLFELRNVCAAGEVTQAASSVGEWLAVLGSSGAAC
jgi:hypothetical protein